MLRHIISPDGISKLIYLIYHVVILAICSKIKIRKTDTCKLSYFEIHTYKKSSDIGKKINYEILLKFEPSFLIHFNKQ